MHHTAWAYEVVLDDNWQNGNYASKHEIDTDNTEGLLLKNDPGHVVFAFDPTTDNNTQKVILDAVDYNGRLYLVADTDPYSEPSHGHVFVYDYKSDQSSLSYAPSVLKPDGRKASPQGIYKISKINDKLYLPESDPSVSWDDGVIHVFDGTTWKAHYYENIRMVHGLKIFEYNGKLYSSHTGRPPDNSEIHEQAIWVSTDFGSSWQYETGWSFGGNYAVLLDEIIVFNNRVIAGTETFSNRYSPEIYMYNGLEWSMVDLIQSTYQGVAAFEEYKGSLYVGFYRKSFSNAVNMPLIWTSDDGDNYLPQYSINSVDRRGIYSFCKYDDSLYALVYEENPNQRRIYKTSDGVGWEALPAVLPGTFIEMINGHTEETYYTYYSKLITYHGRMYSMFPDQGDVYVSACSEAGELVSAPKSIYISAPEDVALAWKGYLQDTTKVKLQMRAASAKLELDNATFTGPDGTQNSYFTESGRKLSSNFPTGTSWMQYKVIMQTGNASKTPYMEKVYLECKDTSICTEVDEEDNNIGELGGACTVDDRCADGLRCNEQNVCVEIIGPTPDCSDCCITSFTPSEMSLSSDSILDWEMKFEGCFMGFFESLSSKVSITNSKGKNPGTISSVRGFGNTIKGRLTLDPGAEQGAYSITVRTPIKEISGYTIAVRE